MPWEDLIIQFCSPTLARLKTGGMFRIAGCSHEAYSAWERKENEKLNSSGIYITALRKTEKDVLVYVYRRAMLRDDLKDPAAAAILKETGYPEEDMAAVMAHLRRRLQEKEFPHEIGLFLSYPPEDVRGFIENGGRDCLYCGEWKIYADVERKKKCFERFDRCRKIYRKLFASGRSLQQLAVSA